MLSRTRTSSSLWEKGQEGGRNLYIESIKNNVTEYIIYSVGFYRNYMMKLKIRESLYVNIYYVIVLSIYFDVNINKDLCK